MTSKNGSTRCKNISLSFISMAGIWLLEIILLAVFIPMFYCIVVYWLEMPILMKILGPILFAILLPSMVLMPINGMVITKKNKVYFMPDIRIKKFNLDEISRIGLVFKRQPNFRYAARVKIMYNDGRVFVKEYSNQFNNDHIAYGKHNARKRKLAMALYTIPKSKVDKIIVKIDCLEYITVSIVEDGKIVYNSYKNDNADENTSGEN